MKTIVFNNGATVEYVDRCTDSDFIQGSDRSILEFRFDPTKVTLDQIDRLFTSDNCARLKVLESTTIQVPQYRTETYDAPVLDENGNETGAITQSTRDVLDHYEDVTYTDEFIYDNYRVRCILSRQKFPISTVSNGLIEKEFISIRMAQCTYIEEQVAALAVQNTDTQMALCDVYEMVLNGGTM